MISDWKECTIGEIASVKGGKRLPKGVNLITEQNAHPYIRIRDLTEKTLELKSSYEYVDNETQKCISRYIVGTGDILISIVGTIGLVAVVGESLNGANLTENCVKLIDIREDVDREYLYYFLVSNMGQDEIRKGTVGAVQPKLPIKNIQSIKLYLPHIDIQKRISGLLSAIDCKIAQNTAINVNLEQQAQAIFKSWFVDFEPFGGVMPDDWHLGIASEIIELHDCKRIPLSGSERDKMRKIYPYYGATSRMDYVDNYIFDGIYLLLGEDGTVTDSKGFPILQYVYGKFWVNNHAHIISGKLGYSVESLYLLFSLTNIKHLVTGAVQQKVSQSNLKKVSVVIPDANILKEFEIIIQPIFANIRNYRDENQRLASLRDTLLPKLMNGEIDVSQVQI